MTDERKPIKLEAIEIPNPCPMLWENLDGEGRKRFCQDCGKHVHDLSALTRVEAEELLTQTDAKICISYEQTPDGGIKTKDFTEVFFCSRESIRNAVGLVAGAMVAVWSTSAAIAKDTFTPHRTMGKVSAQAHTTTPAAGQTQAQTGTSSSPAQTGANLGPGNGGVRMAGTPVPTPVVQPVKDSSRINGGAAPIRMTGDVATPVATPVPKPVPPVARLAGEPVARMPSIEHITVDKVTFTDKHPGAMRGVIAGTSLTLDHGVASSSSVDSTAWKAWHANVAQALFDSWKTQSSVAGQLTMRVSVKPGMNISISKLGVPHSAMNSNGTMGDTNRFVDSVDKAINGLQKHAVLAYPKAATDKVKEASFDLTLGNDSQKFPHFEPDAL